MKVPVAADLRYMREVNSAAILKHLRARDRISVSQLAGTAGLSRQAVSRSLAELREAGLVEFLPPELSEQRSGRPAQLVRFRAEAGYVLGAFVDPSHIRVAVADLSGEVVYESSADLESLNGGHGVGDVLIAQVEELLGRAGLARADVLSAAVGVPGIVDPEAGAVRLIPSMPGLTGDVLTQTLREHLDCPVYLDNDVKLAAQGEQWRGERREHESLVLVYWGERIGAGVLLDGSLYRGANNDAGDLGFLDLIAAADDGPVNPELGRFEAWAGTSALVRLAASELDAAGQGAAAERIRAAGEDALESVIDGVRRGDAPFLASLDTLAHRFGAGLIAIRALLDPQIVVLTGPVAQVGAPLLEALQGAFADHSLNLPELQLSTLGADAVLHGAIRHALTDLERNDYAAITSGRSTASAG